VWLIDYEYSGNNDAFFELGNTTTECNFTEEQVDAWVEAYLGRAPSRAELARVRLQALCSEYGWSLWGFIQAGSSPIDYDFTGWGQLHFDKAEARFRGPDLRRWLDEVADGG
jgi:thiamine kinase-like enzyme